MDISEQLIIINDKITEFTSNTVKLEIDSNLKTFGNINCNSGEMVINPECVINKALIEILLHEHAHYLLYKAGFDNSHNIEFMLLYNVLMYKYYYTDNEKHLFRFNLNDYDLSDYKDLKYLNIKLPTYKNIVKRIARNNELNLIISKCVKYAKYIKNDYKTKKYHKTKSNHLQIMLNKNHNELEQTVIDYEKVIDQQLNEILNNKTVNNDLITQYKRVEILAGVLSITLLTISLIAF